jgi:mutator protein MutT
MVDVCVGLLLNAHFEVLMTLRGPDKLRPHLWEMPGGKREAGENDLSCLVRELQEELGVEVEVHHKAIATDVFEWDSAGNDLEFELVRCTLYHAEIIRGEPQPLDAVALAHYDMRYALRRIPMCPSAYKFYPYVMRYISELRRSDEQRKMSCV